MAKEVMSPVLCIDPGFRAMGITIYDFNKKKILYGGAYLIDRKDYLLKKKQNGSTKADAWVAESLMTWLNSIIEQYEINWVVIEIPHGMQGYRPLVTLTIITGAIVGWVIAKAIPIDYITPEANKKNTVGNRSATKEEMGEKVMNRWGKFNWSSLPAEEQEHVWDAAALIYSAEQLIIKAK